MALATLFAYPSSDWEDRSYLLTPAPSVVYRVRDAAGKIIYIGMTTNFLEQRFQSYICDPAAWWHRAASVEAMTVPDGQVRAVEAAEIHAHHPEYNKQCPLCSHGRENRSPPLYWTWYPIDRKHKHRLHKPWRDNYYQFEADVTAEIGPKPPNSLLRLIDRDGWWEPGNIVWSLHGRGRG